MLPSPVSPYLFCLFLCCALHHLATPELITGQIVVLVFKAHPVLVRSPAPPCLLAPSPLWHPPLPLTMLPSSRCSKHTGIRPTRPYSPWYRWRTTRPPRKDAIDQLAAAVVSPSVLPLFCVLTGVVLFVERLRAYPLGYVCLPFGELGSGRVQDFLSLGGWFAETRRLQKPERGYQEPIQSTHPVCRCYNPCQI
jgi:hypothetical protein